MRLIDKTLLKFFLVGAANTLFGAVVMFGLYNLAGCGYWISSVANYALGSVLSFFLNKYFTFGVRRWSVGMIAAFMLTIGVSYGAAYGAARPLMRRLLEDSPQRFRENGALFTGMCLFTGLNYLGQRFIVFRKKTNQEEI